MNVYEIVTDKILSQMDKGVIPWIKPWSSAVGVMPTNLISGKPYRGINPFLLGCAGFASPYWLSYKQAQAKGGSIRKGEQATMVVFWKIMEKEEETGRIKKVPMLRYYNIFNVEQTEGIDYPVMTNSPEFQPIEKAEAIANGMQNKPRVQHGESKAYYVPALDYVNMPAKNLFNGPEEYYSTLFHELAHSTGHESRLDRKDFAVAAFGSECYSKEELVAEFASAFLCQIAGLEKVITNQTAYIQNWMKALKNDQKMAVLAAAQAQRAADYILGDEEETHEEE